MNIIDHDRLSTFSDNKESCILPEIVQFMPPTWEGLVEDKQAESLEAFEVFLTIFTEEDSYSGKKKETWVKGQI